ncbi:hypothetical protein CHUAL_003404 [Chamberlinius hualienensis]
MDQSLLDYTAIAAAAASDNMCPVCGITFRYRNNLYRHRRTHCDTRVRHNCEHCGKSFSRKDTLQLHARVKHQSPVTNESLEWKATIEPSLNKNQHEQPK